MAEPGPLLEPGRDGDLAGDDARRPAERMAASSSFLVGSCICEGFSVALGPASLPQVDVAVFTDGRPLFEFSLSSSGAAAGLGRCAGPNPRNSGTASLRGVTGALSTAGCAVVGWARLAKSGKGCAAGAGLSDLSPATLGLGDTTGDRWEVAVCLVASGDSFAGGAGPSDRKPEALGFLDNIGLEKDGDCLGAGSGFSVEASGSAGFWTLPSEAIMTVADDFGPAIGKRADAVVLGDGLVADGPGEGAIAASVTGFAVANSTSGFVGSASGLGLLTSAAAAPPFRRFGPLARPLRMSCN